MSCPLCRERKGKRRCPAKDALICSTCCGSKRRVEIDCPDDCVYLTGAHAGSWEGRETERVRDLRRLAPQLQGLSEPQQQRFAAALARIAVLRSARRDLTDRRLLEALAVLRRTAETRKSGLIYEHAAADPRVQDLVRDLGEALELASASGASDVEQLRIDPREPSRGGSEDLGAVLSALEASIAAALKEGGSTEFLDTADRVAAQLRASPAPARRLIVEP